MFQHFNKRSVLALLLSPTQFNTLDYSPAHVLKLFIHLSEKNCVILQNDKHFQNESLMH